MTYAGRRLGVFYQHSKYCGIAAVLLGIRLLTAMLRPAVAQSILGRHDEAIAYRADMKQHFAKELRKLKITPFREVSLVVAFRVDKSGKVLSSSIIRPSGDPYIDRGVGNFLSKDLSFRPFLAKMQTKQLYISVPIFFRSR